MKLKSLIENILLHGLSRLKVNRIAYLACHYYKKDTNEQLIKNLWTIDEYGPYLHEIGKLLNSNRNIKKIEYVNCYGRNLEKFEFTKTPKKVNHEETVAIEKAIDSYKSLNYIEFSNLLREIQGNC